MGPTSHSPALNPTSIAHSLMHMPTTPRFFEDRTFVKEMPHPMEQLRRVRRAVLETAILAVQVQVVRRTPGVGV
jgi:hypothetical protein